MTVFATRACSILYDLLVSRDDERPFLIPANICPDVPATFLEAKRSFELIDIAEASLALDAEACLERIGRISGVLFARPYGRERDDVTALFRQLKELRPDLLLIDDKCLCRPDCEGLSVSDQADATLFSTGYAKHVDLGFGGFAHVKIDVPYRRQDGWEEHRRRTVEALRTAGEHKARLNAIYADLLPPEIQMAPELQGWRFNIRVPGSERLVESLFANGLFASRHYAALGEGFPVAERLHAEVVNLFNDRYFDEDQAERTARLVLRHLAG